MLPTFLLAGLGFALAFGPLNAAATSGIAPHEQGLAAGLFNTSFQFGGALVLAVVTAVNTASRGTGSSPQALLDGFRPALVVSLIVAVLGVLAMTVRVRTKAVEGVEPVPAELEPEREAA
jgi:sugar phosphate permease